MVETRRGILGTNGKFSHTVAGGDLVSVRLLLNQPPAQGTLGRTCAVAIWLPSAAVGNARGKTGNRKEPDLLLLKILSLSRWQMTLKLRNGF